MIEHWTDKPETGGSNPTGRNLSLKKAFDTNMTNFVCSWITSLPEQDSILRGKGCDKRSDQIQAPQAVHLFCHTPQPIFPYTIDKTSFSKTRKPVVFAHLVVLCHLSVI